MSLVGYTTFQFWKEVFLVTAILFVIKFYIDRWRTFMLGSKIPGPRSWPIVGNAIEFLENDVDILGKVNYINKMYGFSRLWLGSYLHVAVCTAEDAEIFCTSTELLDRPNHFEVLKTVLGNGLLTASGADWRKAKRLMEPAFKYSSIKNYFPNVQKKSDKLVQILREDASNPAFCIHRHMTNCTFDVIVESTMGYSLNAQNGNVEILDNVEELMAQMWNRAYKPWQKVDFLYRISSIGRDFYRRSKLVQDYLTEQIKNFKNAYNEEKKSQGFENSNDKVFLHRLLDHQEWNDEELKQHVITMITLGFETSTSALCFIIMMLGMHQDVQEKAYQEVSSALGKNFDDSEVSQLDYLDRVVKETLRLFPIAPLTFRNAKEDIQFTKYLVPKGTAVGINIFAIHRDPKQYENPEVFDPDNFLPEKVSKRHLYSYIPFLMGRRKCIAGKFAMISMKIIVAKILLNFKIKCDLKMKDLELRDYITLKTKNSHYPVKFLPR